MRFSIINSLLTLPLSQKMKTSKVHTVLKVILIID